jgi:hypothetical protein
MANTVKPIALWRAEVDDEPGKVSGVLAPLASTGADLQVLMAYRLHGQKRGAIELFPVTGRRAGAAARSSGLNPAAIPALLVEGDNKPGVAYAMTRAIADAGINLRFVVGQAIGRKCSFVVAFDSDTDLKAASGLIRKAAAGRRRARP